jgi:hypothetical protein
MTTRSKRRLALIVLILFLTAALVSLLYNPLREALAPWLASAYGRIWTYYRMIPHPILWLVAVGLGVIVAARSLMLNERPSLGEMLPPASRGRVQMLRLWIRQAATEIYFDRQLALRLGKLALKIQTHTSGHKEPHGPMKVRLESLDMPPHIREYLRSGLEPMVTDRPRFLGLSRLAGLFPRPVIHSEADFDLEEIVQLLEDQLEGQHDAG